MPDDATSPRNKKRQPSKKIPTLWKEAPKLGAIIPSTCLLPLKVPLDSSYSSKLAPEDRWTPQMFFELQKERGFHVGAIIDFTNTDRYYNGREEFHDKACKYIKLPMEGGKYPRKHLLDRFITIVNKFERDCPNTHVAIHCTHGLNRTGFAVVTYLVQEKGMDLSTALEAFRRARVPGLIKPKYLEELHRRYGAPREEIFYPNLPQWAEKKYGLGNRQGKGK